MKNKVKFSYKETKLGIVLSGVAGIMILSSLVIAGANPTPPKPTNLGGLEHPASLNNLINGCGARYVFTPTENQYGVIPEEFLEANKGKKVFVPSHPMIVPVYGHMMPMGFNEDEIRFYSNAEINEDNPLHRETLLRTLFDNPDVTMIWYTDDIAPSDRTALMEYSNKHKGKVIAAPWVSDQELPNDRKVALSKWGISQTCNYYTDTVLEEFNEFAAEHKIERPEEPPVSKLTDDGQLWPIPSDAMEKERLEGEKTDTSDN